jgi:hypothetical protein
MKKVTFGDFFHFVEPEGIEPSSREDKTTNSTCLVDFDFREPEGSLTGSLVAES